MNRSQFEIPARLNLAIAIVLCAGYGYATILQVNCVLDRSPAAVYLAAISAKSHPKRGTWRLHIEPWGPEHQARDVTVPAKLFDRIQPGDSACMVLRKGALGIPWYSAQTCPWNGGPVFLEEGGSL